MYLCPRCARPANLAGEAGPWEVLPEKFALLCGFTARRERAETSLGAAAMSGRATSVAAETVEVAAADVHPEYLQIREQLVLVIDEMFEISQQ